MRGLKLFAEESSLSSTSLRKRLGSVALPAIFRSGLVEQDGLALYRPCLLVAAAAFHILVGSTQGESGAGFVVKQRRFPPRSIVTFGAGGNSIPGELLSVWLLMTLLTLRRGRLEVDVDQPRFKIRRLVAGHAGGSAVCT